MIEGRCSAGTRYESLKGSLYGAVMVVCSCENGSRLTKLIIRHARTLVGNCQINEILKQPAKLVKIAQMFKDV